MSNTENTPVIDWDNQPVHPSTKLVVWIESFLPEGQGEGWHFDNTDCYQRMDCPRHWGKSEEFLDEQEVKEGWGDLLSGDKTRWFKVHYNPNTEYKV